ncbi:hypothetical protein Tco_0625405 [Tanacetum coccineum]|uniref:Uncharacterized protein n=1 Tax=Tanacetum coccineum TaxID=301880 RepID=A0ABQ4WGT5_9ASTR
MIARGAPNLAKRDIEFANYSGIIVGSAERAHKVNAPKTSKIFTNWMDFEASQSVAKFFLVVGTNDRCESSLLLQVTLTPHFRGGGDPSDRKLAFSILFWQRRYYESGILVHSLEKIMEYLARDDIPMGMEHQQEKHLAQDLDYETEFEQQEVERRLVLPLLAGGIVSFVTSGSY